MKLHVIEVTNLNSLYGEQRIDLDADLQGASLFLIQGPTGAGKSTLMDAVSLALFGTTPRLASLGSEKAVAAQIMSRGAGTAQARVEFSKWESGARVRYRATWAVRRARQKPDGNVQATERSLERRGADGAWTLLVSDHRAKFSAPVFKEVLEGFTPHDFQRSMLLAQGRFDAMLHAKPEERAAILERLTATEQYQAIGERAARMRGAWTGRLEGLRARVKAISPTSPEALAAARSAESQGAAAVADLEARIESVRAQRRWLVEAAARTTALAHAETRRAAVTARVSAASADTAALSEHERCAPAFEALDRQAAADRRVQENRAEQGRIDAAQPALEAAAAAATGAATDAADHAAQVEAALEALRSPAQAASRSAERVRSADAARVQADAALSKAEAAAERAALADQRAEAGLVAADAARAAAVQARAALAGDAALVEQLDELAQRAVRIRELDAAVKREQAAAARRATELDAEAAALEEAREAHAATRAARLEPAVQAAEAAAAVVRERLGVADPDTALARLRERVDVARQRQDAVQAAVRGVADRDEATAQAARRASERAAAAQAVEAARQAVVEARVGAERARAELTVRREACVPLERIAALGQQRADLTPDTPCPLCGGTDHPYVNDPDQRTQAEEAASAADAARSAVAASEAAWTRATDALSSAQAGAASARSALEAAERVAAEAAAAAGRRVQAADATLAAAGVEAGASADAVVAARVQAENALAEARRAVEAAERDLKAARDTAAQAERVRRQLEDTDRALAGREAGLTQARADLEERRGRVAAQAADRAATRAELARRLARFDLVAEPAEAGMEAARDRARAWQQAETAWKDAVQAAVHAATTRADRAEALREARARAAEAVRLAQERRAAAESATGEHAAARAELADAWGRCVALDRVGTARQNTETSAPSALLAEQTALVRAAVARRDAAARDAMAATRRRDDARARLALLRDQSTALAAAARAADAALAEALAAVELADAAALAARRLPAERLAALQALRRELERASADAAAAVKAAAEQRARHRSARPDTLPADATPALLDAAEQARVAELATVREALDAARATLLQAAEKESQLAQVTAELRAAESDAAVWLRLHDLIGKGDGKAFKLFAQALNLDQLLSRANRHLRQLNDRYRLATERDEHGMPTLEFVVEDRWRPGQHRSLKTLSGGESFLVSLALALGLSDLRTSSMPVETLLLDEGFGTLDPDTLDTALAALQQLQASGRQVGIISHVVGLQERIEARVHVEPIGEGRSRVSAGVAGG